MDKNNREISHNGYRKTIYVICATICAISCLLFILFGITKNKTLYLFAIIGLTPAITNIILLLPKGHKIDKNSNAGDGYLADLNKYQEITGENPLFDNQNEEVAIDDYNQADLRKIAKDKANNGAIENLRKDKKGNWQSFIVKLNNFYYKYRAFIVAALIVVAVIVLNGMFWRMFAKKGLKNNVLSYLPVIIAAIFVVYIVLEKICKHLLTDDEEEKQSAEKRKKSAKHGKKTDKQSDKKGVIVENFVDADGEILPDGIVKSKVGKNFENLQYTFEKAILRCLREGLIIAVVASVIVFAAMILKALGIIDLLKIADIITSVEMAYISLFLIISLSVRLIKHEINTAPELTIPVLGIGGQDMGLIAYLEDNTGITMRSLWSIKLIKKILPIACVSVFLLVWALSGVEQIEANEQGVLYRFGKLQDEIFKPGLHFALPKGIDDVVIYNTEEVKRMTIGYESDEAEDNLWTTEHKGGEYKLLLGGGTELVSINLQVEFVISDLKAYVKSSSSPETILNICAYKEITDRTIGTDIDTLLFSEDRAELTEQIKLGIIDKIAGYNTGLEVVNVDLESIHPPTDIAWIYENVIGAGIKAKEIIFTAEALAAATKAQGEMEKNLAISDAEVIKFSNPAEAKATVARFLACIEADEEFGEQYRNDKYIRTLAEAYKKQKLIIIDEDANVIIIPTKNDKN